MIITPEEFEKAPPEFNKPFRFVKPEPICEFNLYEFYSQKMLAFVTLFLGGTFATFSLIIQQPPTQIIRTAN